MTAEALAASGGDHERVLQIFRNLEQGLAIDQGHTSRLILVAHHGAAVGVQRDDRSIFQRRNQTLADGGFAQGGQNIHYLEKKLAERKEKTLSVI